MVTKNKITSTAITILLAFIAVYYVWTAAESSVCTSTGISQQARATWSPTTGCLIEPPDNRPWDNKEIR